jgi:hypothetical protein
MRLRLNIGLVLFLAAVTLACQGRSDLTNTYGSPEALVEAVLEGLANRDGAALEALVVTREEHRDLLWDQLPESRDVSFAFARDLNERNTRKGLNQALADFGGQRFELIDIEFTDDSEHYDGFSIHFVQRLVVRRVSDGREGTLDILDVMVERAGRWKLMDYDE